MTDEEKEAAGKKARRLKCAALSEDLSHFHLLTPPLPSAIYAPPSHNLVHVVVSLVIGLKPSGLCRHALCQICYRAAREALAAKQRAEAEARRAAEAAAAEGDLANRLIPWGTLGQLSIPASTAERVA